MFLTSLPPSLQLLLPSLCEQCSKDLCFVSPAASLPPLDNRKRREWASNDEQRERRRSSCGRRTFSTQSHSTSHLSAPPFFLLVHLLSSMHFLHSLKSKVFVVMEMRLILCRSLGEPLRVLPSVARFVFTLKCRGLLASTQTRVGETENVHARAEVRLLINTCS